jgi:phosphatidate cytidylyltransferase
MMAFNKKVFQTRALTAIVFVAVMLLGLLWNRWSFLLLFSIIHFGCWWEYFNLIEKIRRTSINPYIRQGFILMGYAAMLYGCGIEFELSGYSLSQNLPLPVSVAGFAMLLIGIFQKEAVDLKAMGMSALGWLYISLSWGMMMALYSTPLIVEAGESMPFRVSGNFLPLVIIASIWVNDTMAYIVGSFIGKTPLSPISPKKTWEGTIGGIVLSVLVVALLFSYMGPGQIAWPFTGWIAAIALVASITGTLGDLLESKLKRMAGVKDSGSFMPGHGGFLDRFDSLLLATTSVGILLFLFWR